MPDDPPQAEVLEAAQPYLGPCLSLRANQTLLKNRFDPFERWKATGRPAEEDVWQFESFVAF